MEEPIKLQCANCKSDLIQGSGVIRVERGIVGVMRPVAIEDPLHFCCEGCLKGHFDDGNRDKLSRRVP